MKKSQEVKEKIVTVTMERHIKLTEKQCAQCGKMFFGPKNKTFCSRPCVQRAAYHRNPDAYRESRMRSYRKQKEQEPKK